MEKPRQPEVGDAVVYFDEYRRECNALLEAVHGEVSGTDETNWWTPCVNLIYISPETDKTDGYGRQKDHMSSCTHVSQQHPPVGNYWCFPEELLTSRPDTSKVQTKK